MKTVKVTRIHDGEKPTPALTASQAAAKGEPMLHPPRVPITLVRPDPNQPRKEFDATKLRELADSIKEQGIVHKLLVVWVPAELKIIEPDMANDKKWQAVNKSGAVAFESKDETAVRNFAKGKSEAYYMIVDGERRWRAAQLLKLNEVPIDCRQLTEEQIRNIQIISALQRENLHDLEQAAAFQREIDLRQQADKSFNPEKLGEELGIKRSTIYNRLALLKLHKPTRDALASGVIDTTVAGIVAQVPDPQLQMQALKDVSATHYRGPLSFRDAKKLIDEKYIRNLNPKIFHLDKIYEGTIDGRKENCDLKTIGTCDGCPRRSGNMRATFPDIKNPNVCTDPPCFDAKKTAAVMRRLEQAKNEGRRVMDGEQYEEKHSGLVKASDTCYEHPDYKKWGDLMGKHAPEPILAEYEGELIEVWPKSEAEAAAKKNGVKFRSHSLGSGNEQMLKNQKKKKRLVKVCQYATGLILDRMIFKKGFDERLWKLLAEKVNYWASIDVQSIVAKRRGLARVVGEVRGGLDKWLKQPHTTADYQAFVVEMLLCGAAVGGWTPAIDKKFKELCATGKVDLQECEKAVDAGHTGIAVQAELVPVPETKKPKKKK